MDASMPLCPHAVRCLRSLCLEARRGLLEVLEASGGRGSWRGMIQVGMQGPLAAGGAGGACMSAGPAECASLRGYAGTVAEGGAAGAPPVELASMAPVSAAIVGEPGAVQEMIEMKGGVPVAAAPHPSTTGPGSRRETQQV